MKPIALAAAAAGVLVTLTGCSQGAATSAAPASSADATHAAASNAAARVTCLHRYDAWMRGPVRYLLAALNAIGSASSGGDITARKAALKNAKPAVASAARSPIPACADPKGYWTAMVMHVNAAAGSASSASGRASIMVALKGMPELEGELSTELTRTVGVK